MKDWFPLASYEFYAYLTAGMVVLAAYDRVFMGSALAHEEHWTVVAGVFWAAVAYLVGQILAMPSAAIIEQIIARRFFRPPSEILLGIKPIRKREKCLIAVSGAREYLPFPTANQARIRAKLATALGVDQSALEGEAAFICAFPHARGVTDTATRLDTFISQYGMARNVSLAAAIAAVMLGINARHTHDANTTMLAVGAAIISGGLLLRFMKFYAAYSGEVFRTFDKVSS